MTGPAPKQSTSDQSIPQAPGAGGGGPGINMAPPAISLPKGGGAIRGIGEKFTANPVTGTGSFKVPIATSPGRSGFAPLLALSYDSGSGNGPFGIGWSLSLPSITRKIDKGMPKFRDVEESDVFILSGSEDMVPVVRRNMDGSLALDPQGQPLYEEQQRDGYTVKLYRPRTEGLFARIERWTRVSDGDAHWRSITKDNILTVYGSTSEARIADPSDPSHVFSWLICQSYDDKGNAIIYEYATENADNVDLSRINERNRVRTANKYLKFIRYGNQQPLLIDPTLPSFRQLHVPTPDFSAANWMFEMVFDYGEGHYVETPPPPNGRTLAAASLKPPENGTWPARQDPFSTYRSGFEVRCYRLCQRALLFHHFQDELGIDDCLVGSTEFSYLEKRNGSFISQVVQSGFKRIASLTPPYLKRSSPPLEFEYSVSPLDDLTFNNLPLLDADPIGLDNLPSGIDNRYRWVDLDGEGISGILTEDADAWFYKRNLGSGRFAPVETVSPKPSLAAINVGPQQLLDLAGDGNLDLVDFESPTRGYFSRTDDADWDRFRTFQSLPNIDWKDPNLRFVDLTGDGHADILLTEDQAFSTWFESLAEQGFDSGNHVINPLAEEEGPRLIFADGTQSISLADMSGDGLSDLVRIRNGEVSYWPNMGYGRFGAKVTLDNVPWFDDATSFDQSRVHLTDTDGSGPTDIVYLGLDGIRIYMNEHGNSLSDARLLEQTPRTDNHTNVSVVDFLGRGTACLVWSSSMPADARRPIRYLDLMRGIKPHLLNVVRNNLGSETRLEYKSSTEFYLADKAAGTPWITRLPFPVHVVARIESDDLISGNRFTTTYSYHHGYFDGYEREFRGFGRVDQNDTEEFGALAPTTNLDQAFHVPPTLTKTWFHTGAYFARGERISRQFEDEYFREDGLTLAQAETMLLDDTSLPEGLADSERREAVRSLKGAILHREIYALDDSPESGRPYTASERNYVIKLLQPQAKNRYSVFFTHERESIDLQYERMQFAVVGGTLVDVSKNSGASMVLDPRITHTANLVVDDYGNVLQSASIAYGRRFDDSDPVMNAADRKKQKQQFATITKSSFTAPAILPDAYRAPLPAEVITYELLKLIPSSKNAGTTNFLGFDELVAGAAKAGDGAHDLSYEDFNAMGALGAAPYRRPIEHMRTRYRSNNLAQLLPLNTLQVLAIPGESYKLAFTPGLLTAVFQRQQQGQPSSENLLPNPGAVLRADSIWADRGGYVDLDGNGNWWIPSGHVCYHIDPNVSSANELAEAVTHFFQQRRFRDPFAHDTLVDYANDFLPIRVQDALGNTTEAIYDYRVLQPKQLTDANGNRSFVAFDALGLPVAAAIRGKISETLGDSLDDFTDFDADPSLAQLQAFVASPIAQASSLLKSTTSRFVYDVDRFKRCGEPPFAATLARETHVSDSRPQQASRIQVAFVYSDGFGRELQSKIPAEPGDAPLRDANVITGGDIHLGPLVHDGAGALSLGRADPRWVGKGRTVYNNKGKPVKQYEPFFSSTHLYEPEPEMTDSGVTQILLYDPVERVVAKLHPNHTYEKVVFDPWKQATWDVNDTVAQLDPKTDSDVGDFFQLLPEADYLPTWYDQRRNGQKGQDEKDAAERAAAHKETPTVAYFDTLGRAMLTVNDNGLDANGLSQKYPTRVNLDIEGNRREVVDAKNRTVIHYDHDMSGNPIAQASMEAGNRWTLNDVVGKPIRSWDSRGHTLRMEYDELRRPVRSFAIGVDPKNPTLETCFDVIVYGESAGSGLTGAQILERNLRGRAYQRSDTAGVATTVSYDFKGNPLGSTHQLVQDYKTLPDWSKSPLLESEIFASGTTYDALNRPIQIIAPHSDRADAKLNILQPGYNEANLLERMDIWLNQLTSPSSTLAPASANLHAVTNVDYNAKGQRTRCDFGNGASTAYAYDDQTFRLIHLKTTATTTTTPSLVGRLLGRGGVQTTPVFQDLFYTYDPVGNITHIRDDAQQTIYFKNQVLPPVCDYFYDPTYRLIQATGRESIGQLSQPQTNWDDEFRINLAHPADGAAMRKYTEQYFYDAVGNFDRLVHQASSGNWTRIYSYNEASLLEASKKSNRLSLTTVGSINEPYSHDAHGNMIAMPHLTLIQWDFKDQLSATSRQFVNPATPPANIAETTYYVYDSAGQRIRKVTERQGGTRKEERIYLGGFEVYRQYTPSKTTLSLERETLHVMDDKQCVALVETRTQGSDGSPSQLIRYELSNHLSSATIELDDKVAIISYEEYFPYGSTSFQAVAKAIKSAAKRYRYTGKERDEETGFNYHGARYYAPWLGRWTTVDPAGISDGLNIYFYVRDNPVNLIDSSGNEGADPKKPPSRWAVLKAAASVIGAAISYEAFGSTGPPKILDPSHFTEVGTARQAFLANALGIPFEKPTDPAEKEEWERGERVAIIVTVIEAILSEGSTPGGSPGGVPATINGAAVPRPAAATTTPPVSLASPALHASAPSKSEPASAAVAATGNGPNQNPDPRTTKTPDAQIKAERQKYLDSGKAIRVIVKATELHHVASDKSAKYTPIFEKLFADAGLSLQDKENLVSIEGHGNAHGPDYHEAVLARLNKAVEGKTPGSQEYKDAFKQGLSDVKRDVARPGSTLNDLVTPH
jgi:RHS repeat-associated protein